MKTNKHNTSYHIAPSTLNGVGSKAPTPNGAAPKVATLDKVVPKATILNKVALRVTLAPLLFSVMMALIFGKTMI